MRTSSEKVAIEEETKIANIEWLIDLSALSNPLPEDEPVKFQDGRDFKFDDEISINTTRTNKTATSTTYTTPPRRSPPSILHNYSSSVASSVTNDSRIVDLEQGMDSMDSKLNTLISLMTKAKADTLTDLKTDKPSPPPGGGGQ